MDINWWVWLWRFYNVFCGSMAGGFLDFLCVSSYITLFYKALYYTGYLTLCVAVQELQMEITWKLSVLSIYDPWHVNKAPLSCLIERSHWVPQKRFSGRRWTCLLTKIHATDKTHTVIFTERAEAWLRLGLTSRVRMLVLTTSQLSRATAWTPPVASANCPWTETSGATLSCRGNEAFYDYGSSLRRQAGVRAAPRGRNDRPAGYHAGSSATMCIFIYFLNELPLKIMKL